MSTQPVPPAPPRIRRLAVAAVGLALLCAGSLPDRATATTRPPPVPRGATLLPNGRYVAPAGRTYALGDFSLGLAISPNGRLAVTTNNGQGHGLNAGFADVCDGQGVPGPCPYGVDNASRIGDPLTPAPDESLSVVDLASGRVSDVTAVPTVRDPGHPTFNNFGIGATFSPDGSRLFATGGGSDQVYEFAVSATTLTPRPALTLALASEPHTAEPPAARSGRGDGREV